MIELSEVEKQDLDKVKKDFDLAHKEHERLMSRCNHFHGLYHNFTDWRQDRTERRDEDIPIGEFQRDWGAKLFIPLTFSLIETILPRLVANDPSMTLRPPDLTKVGSVDDVKHLLERQSRKMDFDLKLQDVGKSGLMYGLGVNKNFWRLEKGQQKFLREPTVPEEGGPKWVEDTKNDAVLWDDPDCEAVDIWDFFWDPFAYDLRTATFLIHRTWRSPEYVKQMFDNGTWKVENGLEPADLEGLNGTGKYDESRAERMRQQGYRGRDTTGGRIHEVWEWHGLGREVKTILDRALPVQKGANPHWHGEYPFQIYRPTKNLGQFMGKSEIEPVEDLQEEMNTFRGQRIDNATVALMRSYAYTDGQIDPADMKVGPGVAIPVKGDDPRNAIMALPHQDIPNSSFQEVGELRGDFDRTSGVNDPVAGVPGGGTATESQLVYNAVSQRILLKTKRMSREVVRPCARQVFSMDQQRIREERAFLIAHPPDPRDPQSRYAEVRVGPEQLQGDWELEPDDGSLSPENVAQDRQDAVQFASVVAQPMFNGILDPRRVMDYIARKFGIEPESLMGPQEPRVPPVMLDLLAEAGVNPQLLEQAWQAAELAEAQGEVPEWPPKGTDVEVGGEQANGQPSGQATTKAA